MIRTVGHGTLAAEDLVDLLEGAGIDTVVDVRRYPGSRRHPHFGREEMERWLPDAGVRYLLSPALGGRRRRSADSPNTAWRNAQFAAYADHMASEEFAHGMAQLLSLPDDGRVAIMCSESLWWRCHRRLVADHLMLVEGRPVEHLMHSGKLELHDPMAEAVVVGGHLEYPAGVRSRVDPHQSHQDADPDQEVDPDQTGVGST